MNLQSATKKRINQRARQHDKRRIEELETILGECYQVIGSLADQAGRFGDGSVTKALDNASAGKLVHKDVLPFV